MMPHKPQLKPKTSRRFLGTAIAGAWVGMALVVGGCETNEDDMVYQAQTCLNQISSSNTDVKPCLSKVDGLTSKKASEIRCAAYYLGQGFYDPNKFATAFNAIKNSSNAMAGMAYSLAFSDSAAATNLGFADVSAMANKAFAECKASGSSGYAMLASSTRMGTSLATAGAVTVDGSGNVTAVNPTQLSTLSDTELGETATVIINSYCTGSQSTSDVCKKFDDAVTDPNASSATVGCEIKKYLDPSATCS